MSENRACVPHHHHTTRTSALTVLPSLSLSLHTGLHLWPAGQDPGHAKAEHTPEEVRVPSLDDRGLLLDNRCPPPTVATAIPGSLKIGPGAPSGAPHAPGPGASSLPPQFSTFGGFFIVIKRTGFLCFYIDCSAGPLIKLRHAFGAPGGLGCVLGDWRVQRGTNYFTVLALPR